MPEVSIQQAFEFAVQHHQSGRLAEAEALYRQILAVEPRHSDSLNLLGVIAAQVGRHDTAIELMREAISVAPGIPLYYSNLGEACREAGRLEESIAACRQAITLKPDYPEAHGNLGGALCDKGCWDEAIASSRQAIALRPAYPEAHSNLGKALRGKGQLDEAIAACRQAIELKPGLADACHNLGLALYDKGHLDEAIAAYRQSTALRPASPKTLCNLGNALRERGLLDEAIAAFRQAIALKPDLSEACYNLGLTHFGKGSLDEAIAAYRQAIALKPDFAPAFVNLGGALCLKGCPDEAAAACRRAVELKPDLPEAHNNLGNILKDEGQFDEAIAAYRQAIALKPDLPVPASNLLLTAHYHPGWNAGAIAEEHRRWNQQHGEPLRQFIRPHANDRNPGRRLRVGLVSPDFCSHPVAFFLEGLLEVHDREEMEVFCYSDVMNPDVVTGRMKRHAGHWRRIVGLADAQVADLIREDRIDILVDLAGHTGDNRLPVFARKPAPVQVTWLGYCDTTGLAVIDYRITDAHADPPGSTEALHSEQLIRLPRTFASYRPVEDAPPVCPLPAPGKGRVTFASFHTRKKLNEPLLELWAEILGRVPGSRLMLVSVAHHERMGSETLEGFFGNRGIDAARLEFRGRQSLADYLALHGEADVLLDCHPFSGHTTSCHALWMGVPVVTQAGRTHCSRMVASVLSNVGLPELVATSPEEYVKLAVELANDLPRLAELRSTLRERMRTSPLMDAAGFARDMEAACRDMWRKWCAQPMSRTSS